MVAGRFDLGAEVRCILVLRQLYPLEVAASLAARDGYSLAFSLRLWLRYVLDAEFDSRQVQRCWVSYEGLLDDWEGLVLAIASQLAIEWPRQVCEARDEVESFLSSSLRHHCRGAEDLEGREMDWAVTVLRPRSRRLQLRLTVGPRPVRHGAPRRGAGRGAARTAAPGTGASRAGAHDRADAAPPRCAGRRDADVAKRAKRSARGGPEAGARGRGPDLRTRTPLPDMREKSAALEVCRGRCATLEARLQEERGFHRDWLIETLVAAGHEPNGSEGTPE